MALGYLLSKASSKLIKTELNIPLALTLSIIPDIDIIIPFLEHRGPTHSIIISTAIFTPIFLIYRKRAIPYFIALNQHFLIGDYLAGSGIQLLWPATTQYYGLIMGIKSPTNIAAEWILFIASMILIYKIKDINSLLQPYNSNLILSIPIFSVLLPTLLAFPTEVPPALILPHIILLILFVISIIIDLRKILEQAISNIM